MLDGKPIAKGPGPGALLISVCLTGSGEYRKLATMRLLRVLLVLACAGAVALAQTNAPVARRLSLEDAIQRTLEKNLDLRIARYTPSLAQATLEGAYAGYDPLFSISGEHDFNMSGGGFNSSINSVIPPTTTDRNAFSSSAVNGLTPWGLNYSLSGNISESYGSESGRPFDSSVGGVNLRLAQPLLKNFWIDQTRLDIRVSKNRVKWSDLGLKQVIMKTVTTVEQAYYDLIYARENVKVQEKAVQWAKQLMVENRKRVEVGALAPLDEQQAEAQAATYEAALLGARNGLAMQENTLKHLLSDDYAAWASVELVPTITLTAPVRVFDRQLSWSRGLTERPDLLQAKLDIEQQGIVLKYDYNQLFPELDIIGGYGHSAGGVREFEAAFDELANGSRPNYYYGGQLSIPIGNIKARAAYRGDKLTMEQLLLTLKNFEQTIMVTIDNDIKLAQTSYEQVGATRAAREYAAEALDAEEKKLQSGKSTTYTVLQMQRDLTAAQGNEIQALANYNKALSQLSLDEGTTLERFRIDVEVK